MFTSPQPIRAWLYLCTFIGASALACAEPEISDIMPEHFQGVPRQLSDEALAMALDEAFQAAVDEGFVGSIGVARGGRILFAKGAGDCDRLHDIECSSATVYDLGSVTKAFTGMAVVALEAEGKIRVEDRLGDYVEGLDGERAAITLHQLLTHTAGFEESVGGDYSRASFERFHKLANREELRSKPGEAHHYSNIGYSYLARVIEVASGQSYEAYLNEQFFKPAGMEHTGYVLPDWRDDDVAAGYWGLNKRARWGKPHKKPMADDGAHWHLRGNGGLMSSVDDVLAWHLGLRAGQPASGLYEHFFVPYAKESDITDYNYGMVVIDSDVGPVAFHDGSNMVFYARIFWLRDPDVFVIGLTNAFVADRADLMLEMTRIAAGFVDEG